jgi:hypothetical protein
MAAANDVAVETVGIIIEEVNKCREKPFSQRKKRIVIWFRQSHFGGEINL